MRRELYHPGIISVKSQALEFDLLSFGHSATLIINGFTRVCFACVA
jgi:hypothetical protein